MRVAFFTERGFEIRAFLVQISQWESADLFASLCTVGWYKDWRGEKSFVVVCGDEIKKVRISFFTEEELKERLTYICMHALDLPYAQCNSDIVYPDYGNCNIGGENFF